MARQSPLPVLAKEVAKNQVDFSRITLFVIQHMKGNTVEFIRLLKRAGFQKIVLIGKPYSRDARLDRIYADLATVITPTFEDLEQPDFIAGVLRDHLTPKSNYLCFDMSGYFSRYFTRHQAPRGLLGVIEETKNGLWFRKDQKFTFPMLSVASSKLKDFGESVCIARAIARTGEFILINAHQKTFTGEEILILGYGVIGKYLSEILRHQTCVSVYDISSPMRFKAYMEGHTVLPDLKNISGFDIIIGITGQFALEKELMALKPGVVLINGSTGRREFNFAKIKNSIRSSSESEYETVYTLKNNKRIYVMAHGYPVNFFRTESIPEYVIDLVLSEMFVLAKYLTSHRLQPGYFPMESAFPEIEDQLATSWLKHWL